MADAASRPGRRTFAPVVLVGLLATGLMALGGHKTVFQIKASFLKQTRLPVLQDDSWAQLPLAGALALVALACWGVLLVARRRTRRVVAVLAALAAAGVVVDLVVEGVFERHQKGVSVGDQIGWVGSSVPLQLSAWWWLTLLGAVVAVGAALAALRFAAAWPEMGARYDAPTTAAPEDTVPAEEQSNLELWKSLDEGRDPTE